MPRVCMSGTKTGVQDQLHRKCFPMQVQKDSSFAELSTNFVTVCSPVVDQDLAARVRRVMNSGENLRLLLDPCSSIKL